MSPSVTPAARLTVPAGEASAEIVVKNSTFVGTVVRAADAEQARQRLAAVRARYPDASHHAWAYIIEGGPQGEIGSSDDGEPGGTAGRPMLAVLEGRGLVQAVAIGTRYFGGIKLGTGGLVRAYSECIRQALLVLPVAQLVYHLEATVTIDYALYGSLKYTLPRQGVLIDREDFAEAVQLALAIPPDSLGDIGHLLREATSGRVVLEQCISGGRYVEEKQ